MAEPKLALLQGTLDLLVLKTLASMGSLHGYCIARRIEQVSGKQFLLNQGTIYASLAHSHCFASRSCCGRRSRGKRRMTFSRRTGPSKIRGIGV